MVVFAYQALGTRLIQGLFVFLFFSFLLFVISIDLLDTTVVIIVGVFVDIDLIYCCKFLKTISAVLTTGFTLETVIRNSFCRMQRSWSRGINGCFRHKVFSWRCRWSKSKRNRRSRCRGRRKKSGNRDENVLLVNQGGIRSVQGIRNRPSICRISYFLFELFLPMTLGFVLLMNVNVDFVKKDCEIHVFIVFYLNNQKRKDRGKFLR